MNNMTRLSVLFALIASPALAATGPFFSLYNTDFVTILGFLVFVGVLVYFKIPGMLMEKLDNRAAQIKSDLDEARALREEAQIILASYERKQKEVAEQSARIVAAAREDAAAAAEQAKEDLKASVARRLQAALDQIASAEAGAVKEVRDTAISVAVAVAAEVLAKQMSATGANQLIDAAISEVEAKLH
ncbi:MAG: F-type H+-transporting ATPase subunit b [Paracoccaceae bacterium]|jgi:F-type H+-transporting ATPase subunit b